MPSTTFDRFDKGMDTRRGESVQDANALVVLQNAYVSKGYAVQKRPGTTLVTTLESGTVGLAAGGGKLNTFYGHGTAITHANALFVANRVAHRSSTTALPNRVRAARIFNGFLYASVEYDNGDTFHSYLDTDPVWTASEAKALSAFVQPVTPDGYRYECTVAGDTGAFEPDWPASVGSTVSDGTVTWTCCAKDVKDQNCPHHESFTVAASKIWSPGAEVVRYCATNAPRDWTTTDDAGFLPTGVQALGSPTPTGVGRYRNQLAVAHNDSLQVWNIDPNPALLSIDDVLEVGSDLPFTLENLGQDLHFLSPFGFRSISLLQNVDGSLSDTDTGGPVDDDVSPDLSGLNDVFAPQTVFYRGGGQLWCHVGAGKVWVYTYSRHSKVKAWSFFQFPFTIDAMAELNSVLYLRAGDEVHRVDASVYGDDGVAYEVVALLPYLSVKKSGQLKHWLGMDSVMKGAAAVSFLWDPDDATAETSAAEMTGDTRNDGLSPVEVTSSELGVRFVNSDLEDWRLDQFTLYYDVLGVM